MTGAIHAFQACTCSPRGCWWTDDFACPVRLRNPIRTIERLAKLSCWRVVFMILRVATATTTTADSGEVAERRFPSSARSHAANVIN